MTNIWALATLPKMQPATAGSNVLYEGRRGWLAIVSWSAMPVALLALATTAYACAFQIWVYGDGPQLIDTFLFSNKLWMHVLYIPAARALAIPFYTSSPIDPLRWLSILSGAFGVAGTYGIALSFGAKPRRAAYAALLAGSTPAIWFFSSTIEVHALHFCVVALSACVIMRLPWERLVVSLLCIAALVPLLYFSHKSAALLAPGLLALAMRARERRTAIAPNIRIVLTVGSVIAFAFLSSMLIGGWLVPEQNTIGGTLDFITQFRQGPSLHFLFEAILLGLGLLLPLALLGLSRTRRSDLLVLVSFVLPILVFFSWYGEATRGGYFVAMVPFLAVLAERALSDCRLPSAMTWAMILAQTALSITEIRAYEDAFSRDERQARVSAVRRAIGEAGIVVSFEPTHQPVTLDLPRGRELNVRPEFMSAAAHGMDPATSARETIRFLRDVAEQNEGRIVLDLGLERRGGTRLGYDAYLLAIETAAAAEFGDVVRSDLRFPLIVVR